MQETLPWSTVMMMRKTAQHFDDKTTLHLSGISQCTDSVTNRLTKV